MEPIRIEGNHTSGDCLHPKGSKALETHVADATTSNQAEDHQTAAEVQHFLHSLILMHPATRHVNDDQL